MPTKCCTQLGCICWRRNRQRTRTQRLERSSIAGNRSSGVKAVHPNVADVNPVSVGTDPGLALKTRKGTGFYKIPSLRGVWYRPRLLHDASFTSLEEMFDAARLSPTYTPKGWNPPGVTERAVTGHQFGIKLDPRGKAALMAFPRSL